MRKRHPDNTNLTLHHSGPWRGYDVQLQRGPLFSPYLERMEETMLKIIDSQARTMAVRLDLSLPLNGQFHPGDVIGRFIQSLRAQINTDLARRKREGKSAPDHRLKYICVRERSSSHQHHFHVCLFLNGDCYRSLGEMPKGAGAGSFDPDIPPDIGASRPNSLAKRIVAAWARALGWGEEQAVGLVHFCEGGVYCISRGSVVSDSRIAGLFNRLSYFAKATTKEFGDGCRNLRCSHL